MNTPNIIDIKVGERVRARRKMVGLSQNDLAQAIGLTFQQIQKYERGTNRVSASKLFEIAKTLTTPIDYFFAGMDGQDHVFALEAGERAASSFMLTNEGQELAQHYPNIKSGRIRRKIAELVRSVAGEAYE